MLKYVIKKNWFSRCFRALFRVKHAGNVVSMFIVIIKSQVPDETLVATSSCYSSDIKENFMFPLVTLCHQSEKEVCLDSLSLSMGHLAGQRVLRGTTFAPHPFLRDSAPRKQCYACFGLFGIPTPLLPSSNKVTKRSKQRNSLPS